MVGGPSTLKKAARKIVRACGSFSRRQLLVDPVVVDIPISSSAISPEKRGNISEMEAEAECSNTVPPKSLCAICLEALNYGTGGSPGQAIFTAQCSHAFHFACISSNVRHGSVTCPICRAHWTQLPRNLNPPLSSLPHTDPILRILDDSIATFRVHRRSFLRSARYNDDDPVDPHHTPHNRRLHLSLIPIPCSPLAAWHGFPTPHHLSSSSALFQPLPPPLGHLRPPHSNRAAYLSVKLSQQQATDLVLVAACSDGPHLRLLKQSMALVVFSLRPVDRLAIVTYSSTAARAFPLRRMTSHGKRTALQVIDRIFYMGQADPVEGLRKSIKIIEDRAHKNPHSCILHLCDNPTSSHRTMGVRPSIPIYRFQLGFGFGTSNGLVMHEFEEFLSRMLRGVVRETQLRIGDDGGVIRLGELSGGEDRRVPIVLGECENVRVGYSYVEGGADDECITTGEAVVSIGGDGKRERSYHEDEEQQDASIDGRTSSVESWDYHDPYMARRWAKHLQGYRP